MTKQERIDRATAIDAVDHMHTHPAGGDQVARALGRKVLRPPPGRIADRTCSASRWALVADRKAGVVHDPRPVRVRDKVAPSASFYEDHDTL